MSFSLPSLEKQSHLNIYHVGILPKNILGVGERIGIWTQGCLHRCPNCTIPESWSLATARELFTPLQLVKKIVSLKNEHPAIQGLTISGGEPFLQAELLCAFLDILKTHGNFDIMCYSGYSYHHLLEDETAKELLSRMDILIDGLYKESLNNNQLWRGSENQNIILLSARYSDEFQKKVQQTYSRKVSVEVKDNGYFFSGIPLKNMPKIEESITDL